MNQRVGVGYNRDELVLFARFTFRIVRNIYFDIIRASFIYFAFNIIMTNTSTFSKPFGLTQNRTTTV